MQLVLRNEAAAFLAWWDTAAKLDCVHRARSWVESIERPASDVFAIYFDQFGRREDLDGALARFESEVETVRARLDRLLGSLDTSAQRVAELFDLPPETSIDAVVMFGLYGSNAWTVDMSDLPRSFLAVERLPEHSDTCDALVAHELAHAAHRVLRPHPWHGNSESRPGPIAVKLVEEAVAIAASAFVVPGLDDAHYAAFDDRDQAWFEVCLAHHEQIVARPSALPPLTTRRNTARSSRARRRVLFCPHGVATTSPV